MIDLLKAIFKSNTALMNLVAALGILYVGWILQDDLLVEQTQEGVWLIVGLYFVLLILPALTALALIRQDQQKLQWVMRVANGTLVVLWLAACVWIVLMHFPKSWIVMGAVFVAVPGWLNVRALSQCLKLATNHSPRTHRHR